MYSTVLAWLTYWWVRDTKPRRTLTAGDRRELAQARADYSHPRAVAARARIAQYIRDDQNYNDPYNNLGLDIMRDHVTE